MTLNQILYFRKVARLENYHQAAEELYISQPSLSRSMAALESELGITLFEKKGRGVVLTNAGRLFLEHADRIAGDCDIAAGKMKELASGGGKINIGYIFPLAGHYIPHNVRTFLDQEENKNVAFSFWQNHTPAIAQKVKSGELDLGFGGFLKRDDMEFFPLIQQPLVIVSPEQHPIADEPEVPLVKLTRYPVIGYDRASWMGAYTGHLYRKYQLHPNIIMECPDEYSIVALVRENFGIALMPRTDILEQADKPKKFLMPNSIRYQTKPRLFLQSRNRYIMQKKNQTFLRPEIKKLLSVYLMKSLKKNTAKIQQWVKTIFRKIRKLIHW